MTYSFSKRSAERLATCDERLQDIFNTVILHRDCTILTGYRNKEEQTRAFKAGNGVAWPKSKHNKKPSQAVDVMPWYSQEPHIRWPQNPKQLLELFERGLINLHDLEQRLLEWRELQEFANFVLGVAAAKGIAIRWGGHFKSFYDGPHYELIE